MATNPGSPYPNLFSNRSFTLLWVGQTVSYLGDYFYFLAIPVMVNRLTGSTMMVGLAVMAEALPSLLLGPIAGVFVDRWNRKATMIAANIARGLLVLLCLLVRTPEQVWIYYLAGFLMACASRFFFPAQNAVLPLIVTDPGDLLAANGLMQAVMTIGMLAGPALAGFTIGVWGAAVAFLFDSFSFFFSAVAVSLMSIPGAARRTGVRAGHPARAVWEEMKDGMAFVFTNRYLAPLMGGLTVASLSTGAINVVWVPYLQATFGIGPEGLGIVDSAQGTGMLLGGLALGYLAAAHIKKIHMAVVCLIMIGLFFIGMGRAPSFSIIIVMAFGMGLFMVPAGSVLNTILQMVVPNDTRGRVSSAVNAIATAAGLIAMATASLFGERVGLRNVYLICGLINFVAALQAAWFGKEPEAAPALTH